MLFQSSALLSITGWALLLFSSLDGENGPLIHFFAAGFSIPGYNAGVPPINFTNAYNLVSTDVVSPNMTDKNVGNTDRFFSEATATFTGPVKFWEVPPLAEHLPDWLGHNPTLANLSFFAQFLSGSLRKTRTETQTNGNTVTTTRYVTHRTMVRVPRVLPYRLLPTFDDDSVNGGGYGGGTGMLKSLRVKLKLNSTEGARDASFIAPTDTPTVMIESVRHPIMLDVYGNAWAVREGHVERANLGFFVPRNATHPLAVRFEKVRTQVLFDVGVGSPMVNVPTFRTFNSYNFPCPGNTCATDFMRSHLNKSALCCPSLGGRCDVFGLRTMDVERPSGPADAMCYPLFDDFTRRGNAKLRLEDVEQPGSLPPASTGGRVENTDVVSQLKSNVVPVGLRYSYRVRLSLFSDTDVVATGEVLHRFRATPAKANRHFGGAAEGNADDGSQRGKKNTFRQFVNNKRTQVFVQPLLRDANGNQSMVTIAVESLIRDDADPRAVARIFAHPSRPMLLCHRQGWNLEGIERLSPRVPIDALDGEEPPMRNGALGPKAASLGGYDYNPAVPFMLPPLVDAAKEAGITMETFAQLQGGCDVVTNHSKLRDSYYASYGENRSLFDENDHLYYYVRNSSSWLFDNPLAGRREDDPLMMKANNSTSTATTTTTGAYSEGFACTWDSVDRMPDGLGNPMRIALQCENIPLPQTVTVYASLPPNVMMPLFPVVTLKGKQAAVLDLSLGILRLSVNVWNSGEGGRYVLEGWIKPTQHWRAIGTDDPAEVQASIISCDFFPFFEVTMDGAPFPKTSIEFPTNFSYTNSSSLVSPLFPESNPLSNVTLVTHRIDQGAAKRFHMYGRRIAVRLANVSALVESTATYRNVTEAVPNTTQTITRLVKEVRHFTDANGLPCDAAKDPECFFVNRTIGFCTARVSPQNLRGTYKLFPSLKNIRVPIAAIRPVPAAAVAAGSANAPPLSKLIQTPKSSSSFAAQRFMESYSRREEDYVDSSEVGGSSDGVVVEGDVTEEDAVLSALAASAATSPLTADEALQKEHALAAKRLKQSEAATFYAQHNIAPPINQDKQASYRVYLATNKAKARKWRDVMDSALGGGTIDPNDPFAGLPSSPIEIGGYGKLPSLAVATRHYPLPTHLDNFNKTYGNLQRWLEEDARDNAAALSGRVDSINTKLRRLKDEVEGKGEKTKAMKAAQQQQQQRSLSDGSVVEEDGSDGSLLLDVKLKRFSSASGNANDALSSSSSSSSANLYPKSPSPFMLDPWLWPAPRLAKVVTRDRPVPLLLDTTNAATNTNNNGAAVDDNHKGVTAAVANSLAKEGRELNISSSSDDDEGAASGENDTSAATVYQTTRSPSPATVASTTPTATLPTTAAPPASTTTAGDADAGDSSALADIVPLLNTRHRYRWTSEAFRGDPSSMVFPSTPALRRARLERTRRSGSAFGKRLLMLSPTPNDAPSTTSSSSDDGTDDAYYSVAEPLYMPDQHPLLFDNGSWKVDVSDDPSLFFLVNGEPTLAPLTASTPRKEEGGGGSNSSNKGQGAAHMAGGGGGDASSAGVASAAGQQVGNNGGAATNGGKAISFSDVFTFLFGTWMRSVAIALLLLSTGLLIASALSFYSKKAAMAQLAQRRTALKATVYCDIVREQQQRAERIDEESASQRGGGEAAVSARSASAVGDGATKRHRHQKKHPHSKLHQHSLMNHSRRGSDESVFQQEEVAAGEEDHSPFNV